MPMFRWVRYGGNEERIIKIGKRRDILFQSLIDECRRERENRMSERGDGDGVMFGRKTMIDELLELQEKEPDFYTDDILKGFLLAMIAAGTDSSSRTMQWAMSLLLNLPQVLEKVRNEIEATALTPRLVEDSDTLKLTYLRCVINETLRLFSVVPLLVPHLSNVDCSVGGYHVAPCSSQTYGRCIEVLVCGRIHWSSNLRGSWRWKTKTTPFRFMSFGVGRRACPGANLGMRTVSLT